VGNWFIRYSGWLLRLRDFVHLVCVLTWCPLNCSPLFFF
jgi:hypothetical protein